MLTGISGSKTVESCSTICGLSSSVLTGSGSIGGAEVDGEAAACPAGAAEPGPVSALVSNIEDDGGPSGAGNGDMGEACGGGADPSTCGGITG